MKKLLRTTAAFVLLWTGHVFAAAPASVCKSYQAALTQLRKGVPDLRVVELTPAQRAKVEHDFNSAEPPTNVRLSHVYTLSQPHGANIILVLLTGKDCMIFTATIPAAALPGLIGQDI